MTKDEQITEMANDLRMLDSFQYNPNYTISYQRAMGLHSFGYRKQSEVVTEVLANVMFAISKIVSEHIESDNSLTEAEADIIHALVELKKKYTEEHNDE